MAATGCRRSPSCAALKLPAVTLDGKSLVAVIKDAKAPSPHDVLHWQIDKSWAVREGDWKLLFDVQDTTRAVPGTVIPGAFLVNLKDDPSEKTESRRRSSRDRRPAETPAGGMGG